MASNLSQVFIAHADLQGAGTDFSAITGSSAGAQKVGIWTLDGTATYVPTKLFEETFVPTDDNSSNPAEANFTGGSWLYNRLQFVQGTDGNPIASPIINTSDIRAIRYEEHVPSVGAKVTNATANLGDATLGTNIDDEIEVRFVIRTVPTNYLSFAEPNNAVNDISGGGKTFPLGAFNTTNHKVISINSTKSSRAAETDDGFWDDIKAKIEAHGLLNNLFTATVTANTNIVIQSRFPHLEFDMIVNNVTDDVTLTAGTKVAATIGTGNGWQVLQDEKRCRGRYGDFNRMYFPITPTTYTNTSYKYDRITITYDNANFATGAATGIAPQGGTNELVIYLADSSTALAASDLSAFEAAFGIALSTNETHIWKY
tara:strand:+ start:2170 stop:3282 length:1113 start_codon:yes stop_codon:yes gene_type:complete